MNSGIDIHALLESATEAGAAFLNTVNVCVVLAPHPDDESLGCGGLIACLREQGISVKVIFTTDGSMSHPDSYTYPALRLANLRRKEAIQALEVLGANSDDIFFMNKKDAALPAAGEPGFEENVRQLQQLFVFYQPDLLVVPYALDPHRDHRATWQMMKAACEQCKLYCKVLEYPVWLYTLGIQNEVPDVTHNEFLFFDISRWQQLKQEAIARHVSQTTRLINDDPGGFILQPEVLQYFTGNKEYYIVRTL